jgi:hypothetical protein
MRIRLLVGVVAVLILWSGTSQAQEDSIPRLIEYQGELGKTWLGQSLTGVQSVTFALYREFEGGAPLWLETQNVTGDAAGRFRVLLGSGGAGFPTDLLVAAEPRWLGVWVNGSGVNEQSRTRLVSVPYALRAANADTLGGRPVTDFALVRGDSGVSTGKGVNNPVILASHLPGSSTANRLAKFSDDSGTVADSAVAEIAGKVGIGNASPGNRLHVGAGATDALGGATAFISDPTAAYLGVRGAANAEVFLGSDSATGIVGTFTDNDLVLRTNNSAVMTLTTGRRVGIGTVAPSNLLQVGGGAIDALGGATAFVSDPIAAYLGVRGGANAEVFLGSDSGTGIVGTFTDSDLVLRTNNSPVMTLATSGNIGIGKSSPSEKLDVMGNIRAAGNVAGSVIVSTTSTGAPPLIVASTTQVPNLNASLLGGLPASSFGDITGVTAGSGLTGGGTSGDATLALSTAARTRGITYLGGCDTCGVLADTDDQKTIYFNVVGPMTIQSVTCFADAGTPTINIQRDDGSPANVLASDLACSTVGATTTTFSGSEASLSLSDKLDFVMVAASGTAKRVTVAIKAVVN